MPFSRSLTVALLVCALLALGVGCGGGGGSADSGTGINPGSASGALNLKVAFDDPAPRLEVQGEEVLLSAPSETWSLVIDLLDREGKPVIGTVSAQRILGQPMVVVIQGIPFGTWKLSICAYGSSGTLVGEFAQDVVIQPGVLAQVTATLTPTPSGRSDYAYVADQVGNSITGYRLTPTGLAGVPGGPFSSTWPSVQDLAVSPGQDYVFSASGVSISGGYEAWRIQADGSLVRTGSAPLSGSAVQPLGVVAHPSSTLGRVYGATFGGGALAGSYSGGSLSMPAPTGGDSLVSPVVDPAGQFLFAGVQGTNTLRTWSLNANGDLASTGSFTAPGPVERLEMKPDGTLLFLSSSSTVYSYHVSGGTLVSAGSWSPLTVGATPRGMAVSGDGQYLFVAMDRGTGAVGWVEVLKTADLSQVGSADAGLGPRDVAMAADGTLLAINSPSSTLPGELRRFSVSAAGLLTPLGTPVLTGNHPVRVVTARR